MRKLDMEREMVHQGWAVTITSFSSVGAACFVLVVVYLISMGRVAVLMQRVGDEKASLSDPNG